MREVTYESLGVPLEKYQLTKADHREQRSSEDADRWAKKVLADKKAEEAADPVLKAHRDEVARRAMAMIARWHTPDHELMRWRVRLYCGHIVETRRHAECARPTTGGSSSMECPECGKDPSCIVAFEPLGLLAELEAEVSELRQQAAPSGPGDR